MISATRPQLIDAGLCTLDALVVFDREGVRFFVDRERGTRYSRRTGGQSSAAPHIGAGTEVRVVNEPRTKKALADATPAFETDREKVSELPYVVPFPCPALRPAEKTRCWLAELALAICLGGAGFSVCSATEGPRVAASAIDIATFGESERASSPPSLIGMRTSFQRGDGWKELRRPCNGNTSDVASTDRSAYAAPGFRADAVQEAVEAGPMVPSESFVTGELVGLESVHSSALHIAPPQILRHIRLKVLSVRDTGATDNPLRGQEGRVLDAYSKESVDLRLVGKRVKGILIYRGDERGGLFWVYDLQEMPPE